MKSIFFLQPFLFLLLLFSCKKEKGAEVQVTVFKASGNIQPKLDEFRAALGNLNATPGAVGGRREVNWDGVPDSLLDKTLPQNFFNPVGANAPAARQRGLVYDDGEFEVSATGFATRNSQAATEFSSFSGNKVFANVSSLEWPVGFQIAGETTAASVSAFGAVFSDIDREGSVVMEFFEGEKSLGKFSPPAHDAGSSFSFLGVSFSNAKVTKVKISHEGRLSDGQKDISQGGNKDLIVLDDFIYSEPVRR